MDSSPPGSSVHGILQARIQEWVANSFFIQQTWHILKNSRTPRGSSTMFWSLWYILQVIFNTLCKSMCSRDLNLQGGVDRHCIWRKSFAVDIQLFILYKSRGVKSSFMKSIAKLCDLRFSVWVSTLRLECSLTKSYSNLHFLCTFMARSFFCAPVKENQRTLGWEGTRKCIQSCDLMQHQL